MAQFAEGTSVSVEKSQMEIAAMVRKYGATSFATGWQDSTTDQEGFAMVTFNSHNRQVRFVLPIPTNLKKYTVTPGGRSRTNVQAKAALEAETRRRWRALSLGIKAKLEMVESGIASFEVEFLPHTVMPDGKTVGDHVLPVVAAAYAAGRMPSGSVLAIEA